MKLGAISTSRKQFGCFISIGIVIAAALLGVVVLYQTNYYPRTDDAEVFANFIGIAPQVEGPLVRLNVRDNQFVKKGELLYEIDERPYQYALERALLSRLLWRDRSTIRHGKLRPWQAQCRLPNRIFRVRKPT
jgi:multidrug efflux system membrane fusion protein